MSRAKRSHADLTDDFDSASLDQQVDLPHSSTAYSDHRASFSIANPAPASAGGGELAWHLPTATPASNSGWDVFSSNAIIAIPLRASASAHAAQEAAANGGEAVATSKAPAGGFTTLPFEWVGRISPQGESTQDEQLQTTQSSSLIRLTNMRADPRFAGIDGSGFSVVIIDTGADLDHSAFGPDANGNGVADRIVFQYDFSGANDANANDTNGHGTNVAGIIGSQNSSYLGMAPGVNLIILKVFPDGSNSASSVDIEEAAQWVVNNAAAYNIVAVNFSLGSGNFNSAQTTYLNNEFQSFISLGIAPVVATGNSFYSFGSAPGVAQPAADSYAWGVGAVYDANLGQLNWSDGAIDYTTAPDRITSFTQRTTTPGLLDIFAPGGAITNAYLNNSTATYYGTSQAAPHIAGIVALAQEYAVQLSGSRLPVSTLLGLMQSSAVTIVDGDDENDNVVNTGGSFKRVDVYALMEAIQNYYGGGTPSISINDVSITEGNAGTSTAIFTVTRTGGTAAFTVNFATANGTAAAGSDYQATSGTLSFGTNVNTQTVSVTINGDIAVEPNETFFVNLSGANGATIADSQGQGTIVNDDVPDDYADNLSDTTSPLGQVGVGSYSTGNLEVLGDHDWFQVQLTAGITYIIQEQGSGHGVGTLYDPYVRVYNSSSVLQASDDDSGGSLDSYLTFTPSSSGTYYIDAAAFNEAYTGTYRVSLSSIQPDLDLYDNLTASATTVAPGGSTTLTFYVVNNGNAAVGASTTGFYLSTDATITTSDTLLGTRSAPGLTAYGGSMWYDYESQTVTLPGNLAPGTYYVGAIADYNNAITTEITEANNPSNAVQISVQRPDLDLYDNMTVSNSVVGAGGSTTLSFNYVNFGQVAAGPSTTGFYLSTDATITTADTLLTTRTEPALTAYGGSMWYAYESQTVTLPGNLAPGTYYLGAIADYTNAIAETDESNNPSNAVQITVPQPDLDLYDNLTVSNTVLAAGGATTLSYNYVNWGQAPVGTSTTGFYLSTDATITTADTLLTTRAEPGLTAYGGSMWYAYESQTVTLPGNLAPGTYYVGAIADYNNAITNEITEANNPSNAVQISVQRPDLDLYDNMTVSNTVVGPGGSTTLSYNYVNWGQVAVGPSTTGFYLSTDPTITTADTLLTTRTEPGLTAYGGSMWYAYESQTVSLPGNLAPGTYYLGAIADYTNAIGETDESNNASNAIQITTPQPDLDLYDNLTVSNTVVDAGGSTTLTFYVVNNGPAAVGPSTTGFYLSTDATITTADTLIGTKAAPGLTAFGGSMWYDYESQTVTLPGNLAPGTYYLGAIADYNNAVTTEITEANNPSNAVQITVPQPDLDLYDNVTASVTVLAGGASTALTYYVVNFGLAPVGASTTGFYLSTDATITTADTLIGTRSEPALTAYGGSMWYAYETQSVTLPGNLAPGTYYVGAIADYNNAITNESTEANNPSNAVQIAVHLADLDLYDNLTVSNTTVAAGGSTTLNFYVVNHSDAAVGPSTTGFYLSTDANITTADTLLGTRAAPGLTAFAGSMWYDYESQTVTLPSILAPGTYYLGAISDYANAINESDEGNNPSNAVQITVTLAGMAIGSLSSPASASSLTGWEGVDAAALGNSWFPAPSDSGIPLGHTGIAYTDGQTDLTQLVTADAAAAQYRPQTAL